MPPATTPCSAVAHSCMLPFLYLTECNTPWCTHPHVQRLTFDSSSPNGILLFREVSKVRPSHADLPPPVCWSQVGWCPQPCAGKSWYCICAAVACCPVRSRKWAESEPPACAGLVVSAAIGPSVFPGRADVMGGLQARVCCLLLCLGSSNQPCLPLTQVIVTYGNRVLQLAPAGDPYGQVGRPANCAWLSLAWTLGQMAISV